MTSRLNYTVEGAADAPVVTLAHGLATDLTMWDAVVPHLLFDFRVVRYDARGHGRSPAPTGDFTLKDLESDVIHLFDHLGIEKSHFVGLSMGGMVGMGLGLAHADRLDRLVVCDARGDAPEAYRQSWSDRIQKVTDEGIQVLIEPTVDRWFTEEFKRDKSAVARMKAMVAGTSDAGYIGCAQALRGLDYARHLPQMRVPTLFLVGAEDGGAPPETMRQMHQATPKSEFVQIPEAGHLSAVEQPEQVAAEIRAFLARNG